MALTRLPGFTLDPTSSFTFANASVTSNVTAGNIKTDNLLYANGSPWSFGSTYSNANVALYLPTYTGQMANALVAGTVYTNAQPNITSTGTLVSLTVSGLVTATAGGIKVGNLQDTSGTNTVQLTNSNMLVTGNITAGAGGTGNVTATYFIGNGSQLTGLPASYSNANVAAYLPTYNGNFAAGNISVTGNVSAAYFIGDGSQLTGLPASYSNANVAEYLPTYTGNFTAGNANISGTLTVGAFTTAGSSGNISGANYITANFFSGDGSLLDNINGSNIDGTVPSAAAATTAGTVTTAAQPNITSLGTLADLSVSGNATITGNLTVGGNVNYINVDTLVIEDPIIEQGGGANGAPLTTNDGKDRGSLLHYYTTTPVDAFMGWDNSNSEFGFGSNVSISSEVVTWNNYGNIRASYFLGNGSQLTGVSATTATTAATVTTNAQPNITSTGTLVNLTVSGLITATAGGIKVGNLQDASGTNTVQLTNSDMIVTGDIIAGGGGSGNVTATYFIGNGSQLTGLPATYANSNVANYLPTYTGNFSPSNLVVSTSANLGAVGNVTITGGTSGQVLSTDGTGVLSWADQTGGGGGPVTPVAGVQVFTADGSGNTFTLSSTPANEDQLTVNIDGVMQLHSSFSLSGNVVTLGGTPVNGSKVEITNISATAGVTTGKAIAMAIVFGF